VDILFPSQFSNWLLSDDRFIFPSSWCLARDVNYGLWPATSVIMMWRFFFYCKWSLQFMCDTLRARCVVVFGVYTKQLELRYTSLVNFWPVKFWSVRLGTSNFYSSSDIGLKGETKHISSPCQLAYRVGSSASFATYCTGQNLEDNLYIITLILFCGQL
jgi:hypothetical protein